MFVNLHRVKTVDNVFPRLGIVHLRDVQSVVSVQMVPVEFIVKKKNSHVRVSIVWMVVIVWSIRQIIACIVNVHWMWLVIGKLGSDVKIRRSFFWKLWKNANRLYEFYLFKSWCLLDWQWCRTVFVCGRFHRTILWVFTRFMFAKSMWIERNMCSNIKFFVLLYLSQWFNRTIMQTQYGSLFKIGFFVYELFAFRYVGFVCQLTLSTFINLPRHRK